VESKQLRDQLKHKQLLAFFKTNVSSLSGKNGTTEGKNGG
jgi:hypothetical protein